MKLNFPKKDDPIEIGEVVRLMRLRQKISLTELSRHCEISVHKLSAIESGITQMDISELKRWGDAMGYEIIIDFVKGTNGLIKF